MRSQLFLVTLALWAGLASAQSPKRNTTSTGHSLGLGIILGEPSGFTGKVLIQNNHAIDFGVAYSFGDYVLIYADYLFQWPGAFRLKTGEKFFEQLVPYVGVGVEALIATSGPGVSRTYWGSRSASVGAGVRIPLGIEWLPGDPPLGIFLEIAPGIGFIPLTYVFFQGGIGARYYF